MKRPAVPTRPQAVMKTAATRSRTNILNNITWPDLLRMNVFARAAAIFPNLNEVTDADAETCGEQPQGAQSRVAYAPLQLSQEPGRDHLGGRFNLGESGQPSSAPNVAPHGLPEPGEIHQRSGPLDGLLMEASNGTITLAGRGRGARSLPVGRLSWRRGEPDRSVRSRSLP